jgi:hypothetical protein
MANDTASVPNALDTASSGACTRAGAFALLLSLALTSLIPYWLEGRQDAILGKYISLRLELAMQTELLDDSGTWKEYKTTHPNAESTSLSELVQAAVEMPVKSAVQARASEATNGLGVKQRSRAVGVTAERAVPAPPTGLSVAVLYPIDEIQRAADFLVQLDDSDMLARSRDYSNFYNFSVYKWASRRGTLIYSNEIASDGTSGPNDCLRAAMKSPMAEVHPEIASFVPAIGKEALLNCLTVRDLRELADFELPKIPDTTKYSGRGGKEVDVAPGALPRNLYMASLFAEGLLVFVLVYFAAFVRQSMSSPKFPVPGTIFAAFFTPPWILAAFVLALWAPVMAAAAVAWVSRRPLLVAFSALIAAVVLSIHRFLNRKSYFAALNPLRLVGGHGSE